MLRVFYRVLIAAVSAVAMFSPSIAPAAEHFVEIRQFSYVPARLDASPGDTVTWINRDIVPHTASATNGGWDSGEIAPGERKSIVLPVKFERGYFCLYHPAMRAEL